MPVYMIRVSTFQRQCVMQQSTDCESDLTAITIAHSMLRPGQSADVWQGDRKVCQLEAPPAERGRSAA
jgi:hypothetical protein